MLETLRPRLPKPTERPRGPEFPPMRKDEQQQPQDIDDQVPPMTNAAIKSNCFSTELQPGQSSSRPWGFSWCFLGVLLALSHHTAATPLRPVPSPLYGVTVDSIDPLDDIVAALGSLPRRPTTRIVFDAKMPPAEYVEAVDRIREVSYVMGEIMDSAPVNRYTVSQYARRTSQYLKSFGKKVDIWEIGNEVNGDWVGKRRTMARKVIAAYRQVKAKGYRTALTLYYNEGCWGSPGNEMFKWANKYLPRSMKNGLDYVLVSYYEEDCQDLRPDWNTVFTRLAKMFPNSKIGFGEVGTARPLEKADYMTRYYRLNIPHPNYVGGYFWWYFKEDMVPMTQPLWQILSDVMK
jgi:predicted DNA-binding protein YlxM (UPF0122 family)